jgi:NitT/TauT family transport system substrate-binding protein
MDSMKAVRLFALLLLALPVFARAQDISAQTFFMTFVPNIQFAPVYVAIEKGYFADAGIDLTIEHGEEPLGLDLIASGERQFGLISGEQVIAARAQDRPVVYVYEWFQQFPIAVVTPVESGIETVADLRGQRVGLPGRFGATYFGLTALLTANGMTEADVDLQEIGFNAPEVVCIGGVPAATVYANNEPLQIADRAAAGDCGDVTDVITFPVADYADLVSNGIVTNEATIAEQPELVAALVGAFDRGLRDVIANPAEAYLISLNYVENLPLSDELSATLGELSQQADENAELNRDELAAARTTLLEGLQADFEGNELIQLRVLLASIDLWDADVLGQTDAESWTLTQDTLLQMGFVDAPLDDLAAAYTNDFLLEMAGE